jgi:hypothetical protein
MRKVVQSECITPRQFGPISWKLSASLDINFGRFAEDERFRARLAIRIYLNRINETSTYRLIKQKEKNEAERKWRSRDLID